MAYFQNKRSHHLIPAYNHIVLEMRTAFEHADAGKLSLQKALNIAKKKTVTTGKATAEEANEVSEYIKRDINDAAEYMLESSAEFYDWLMLDIEQIEHRVIDLFLSVAEHTRNELEHFKRTQTGAEKTATEPSGSEQIPIYRSYEITCPGTLICENCGTAKSFLSSDEITDCEHCGHHRFYRRQQKNS